MQSQCSGGLTHHDDNADCDGSGCLLACLTACPSARCLCAYLGKPHLPAPPPPPSIHPFRPSVPLLFIYSSLPPLILPPPSLPSLAPMCDKAISSPLLSSASTAIEEDTRTCAFARANDIGPKTSSEVHEKVIAIELHR